MPASSAASTAGEGRLCENRTSTPWRFRHATTTSATVLSLTIAGPPGWWERAVCDALFAVPRRAAACVYGREFSPFAMPSKRLARIPSGRRDTRALECPCEQTRVCLWLSSSLDVDFEAEVELRCGHAAAQAP